MACGTGGGGFGVGGVLLLSLLCAWVSPVSSQSADQYWNNRYDAYPGYVSYTTDDSMYMWNHQYNNYYQGISPYTDPVCSGCDCSTPVAVCTGQSISIAQHTTTKLDTDYFPNTGVTQVSIISTKLQELPTLVNATSLTQLYVYDSELNVDSSQIFPPSLVYLALVKGEITLISNSWFSGINSNLRFLTLGSNKLKFFNIDAFTNLANLLYLGLDGNLFKSFSVSDLSKVNLPTLQHLNLSNNMIDFIQPDLLSKLPELRILEMHNNFITHIPQKTLSNIPNLLHLDLNNNRLRTVTSGAFWQLPQLITLRLHSQQGGGLQSIHHHAFQKLDSLKYLWISDNSLTSFPHSSLAAVNYTQLEVIYADHNSLTSLEKLDEEAFAVYESALLGIRKVSHVPFVTMPNLIVFYLGFNSLSYLNKTIFCGMPNLQTIYLETNLLREDTIFDSFDCLGALSTLNLGSNRIQYITRVLSDNTSLPNITSLTLTGNYITFIQTGAFSNLSTLTHIYLAYNRILTAENHSFPDGIQYIELSGNDFRFLHTSPFAYLSDLATLNLQSNDISYLPLVAFSNCSSLSYLNLDNNQIGWIYIKHFENCGQLRTLLLNTNDLGWIEHGALDKQSFSHLGAIRNMLREIPLQGTFKDISTTHIYLDSNRIKTVTADSFVDVAASYLSLSSNRIAKIESGAFLRVTISQRVTLSSNPIGELETDAFKDSSVSYLYLSGVGLKTIRKSAFNGFTGTDLYLQGNNLQTLEEEAFTGVRIGRTLDLSNSNIQEFTGPIFGPDAASNPSSISFLDLSDNLISYLPDNVFDNAAVAGLDVRNNKLNNYPAAALVGQGLQSILLSDNAIENIPLGSFTGFSNLLTLDLARNKLSTLSDALLEPLTSLQKLYLQDNELISADLEALSDLTTLEELNLANNNLTFIPAFTDSPNLKWVDLTNNHITTLDYNAFSGVNLGVFESISLTGNPLSCDCYLYYSLSPISDKITGGMCSVPLDTIGITFDASKNGIGNHFLSHAANFSCSAINVRATATDTYVIFVQWEAPIEPYPGGTHQNGTSWTYIVTCEGNLPGDPVVTGNRTDNSLGFKTNQQALTFLQPDGVMHSTDYRCYVALAIDGATPSGRSPPAYVSTPSVAVATVAPPVGDADLSLDVALYDFPRTHLDFTGVSTAIFRDPVLVPSPFGGWLKRSDDPSVDPTTESFSDWFRVSATINQVFKKEVLVSLGATVDRPTNRFFSEEYYPLDGLGYGHENQKDCSGNVHNFGFTAAIRAGFTFYGIGNLSVGGGDEAWVYVNRQLVMEVITNPTDPEVPCQMVNLDGAHEGRLITPYAGTVINGVCLVTQPLTDKQFTLSLEIGDTYHLDIFIVERYGCKSRLFLETQSLNLLQPDRGDPPPSDYRVTVPEDLHVGGIVTNISVTDVFVPGPVFNVSVTQGNEARHFALSSDTMEAREEAVPPPAPVYNYTTLVGTDISFVECSDSVSAANQTEPSFSSVQHFVLQGTKVFFTLSSTLDYEVANRYVIVMTTIDQNGDSYVTGTIVVRVKVEDVNDNCPLTLRSSYTFQPQPALKEDPLLYMRATDADSGLNAQIAYHASVYDVSPPLSQYNASHLLTLYDTVYTAVSTVTFTLAAVDHGTPPRGVPVNVSVTLKNSCLLSVLLEPLELRLVVNDTSGDVYLRLPKYYVQTFECDREGGLESGTFLDTHITASSSITVAPPTRARLNLTRETLYGGWVADTFDANQWLQLNMSSRYRFKVLLIQGREDADMWVTSFRVSYSEDGATFTPYVASSSQTVFTGASDRNTVVSLSLDPPIRAVYLRIEPVTWAGGIALRVDVRGCTVWEYEYYLTSCQRCETTWYCSGDGTRSPCGRCEPPIVGDTCGRTPSEHSYGHSDHCSPCPAGWLCHDGYASPCGRYEYSGCNSTHCPTVCTPCGPGHACFNGIRTQCKPGYYSTGYQSHCLVCEAGTYQPLAGQTSCLPCPAGHYSSRSKDRCTPCGVRGWSDITVTSCQQCTDSTQCPCLARPGPCPDGVTCNNVDGTGSYTCGACPPGYSGDGYNCADIDECYEHRPCFQNRCLNTQPGYQCLECPTGYKGTYEDALAWNMIRRTFRYKNKEHAENNYQECEDVDECLTGTAGCDPNSYCMNGLGNYTCGQCKDKYSAEPPAGCVLSDFCVSGEHTCHQDAECIFTGPKSYRCECPVGFAGDGEICGVDDDLDGLPTTGLNCVGTNCQQDNCPYFPNSGQENLGSDRDGNACDNDDDSDGIFNFKDNCRFHGNFHQEETDSDGVGDVCDNCPSVNNSRQEDTDGDGTGDACDTDDDNDGEVDSSDNCPLIVNPSQTDSDSDGVGDVCDNCPNFANTDQMDINQDGYGDACITPGATFTDMDGDGVPNTKDNCQQTPNPDQADVDMDNVGDVCDNDIDGDGLVNEMDNCIYVSNSGQQDADGDSIGDVCEGDIDADGIRDSLDPCPRIPTVSTSGLTPYLAVSLTDVTSPSDVWELRDEGREILYPSHSDEPQMLIGPQAVGSADYSGTWYVDDDSVQDSYIGLVFGYQNNRRFYLVQWSRNSSNLDPFIGGLRGLSIKLVDSSTGPSTALQAALWHSADTASQVSLLWQAGDMEGWSPHTSYRWHVSHRPELGTIRLRVWTRDSLLVDSGDIGSTSLTGGRLGVFLQGARNVIWSNLVIRCTDNENYALSFDGVDDHVTLGTFTQYNLTDSFTLGLWINPWVSPTTTRQPLLCTSNPSLCLYIQDGILLGQYGDAIVGNRTLLPSGSWTHIGLRYEAQYFTLTLFINGTVDHTTSGIQPLDWNSTDEDQTLLIGKHGSDFFSGSIDELRLYRVWLLDTEVLPHLADTLLTRPNMKQYLSAHHTMNHVTTPSVLTNAAADSLHGVVSGATYVQSNQHLARYRLVHPTN